MNFRINYRLLLYLLIVSVLLSCNSPGVVKVVSVTLKSSDDIIEINSREVMPVEYLNTVSLKNLPVDEKKNKFIDLILPSILLAKHRLKVESYKISKLVGRDTSGLSIDNKLYLEAMLIRFKAEDIESLLSKLRTHPTSIVIAQAAIESGWGTSRFFTEANNIFGVWSFNSNENRIKSTYSRNGNDIFLRKYKSLDESVMDYFVTIARGPYKEFRNNRIPGIDPIKLISYLYNYSELRGEYIKSLEIIIRSNNLIMYDDYVIDNKFINRLW